MAPFNYGQLNYGQRGNRDLAGPQIAPIVLPDVRDIMSPSIAIETGGAWHSRNSDAGAKIVFHPILVAIGGADVDGRLAMVDDHLVAVFVRLRGGNTLT